MAAAEDKKEGEAEAPKKGKGKLIIIIVVVLVLVGGGVGAFLAMSGGKGEEEGTEEGAESEAESEEEVGEKEAGSSVMPLDPFIVNLQVKGSFLKTTMQVEFGTPELPPTAEKDLPKIRDAIIRILTSKGAADILTQDGKEKLRAELVEAVNEGLDSEDVTQVYFTEFIVQ